MHAASIYQVHLPPEIAITACVLGCRDAGMQGCRNGFRNCVKITSEQDLRTEAQSIQ